MDGDSAGADLALWQQQLGSGTVVAINSAVPEPTAARLLGLGRTSNVRLRGRLVLPRADDY